MKFRDGRQRCGHRVGAGRAEQEVKCARYRVAGHPGKWRDRKFRDSPMARRGECGKVKTQTHISNLLQDRLQSVFITGTK